MRKRSKNIIRLKSNEEGSVKRLSEAYVSTPVKTIYEDSGISFEFHIKPYIDKVGKTSFIEGVVNDCFGDEGNSEDEITGANVFLEKTKYQPHYKSESFFYAILKYFTDIKIEDIDIDTLFNLVENNSFREFILSKISTRQISDIEETIDSLIEHRNKILLSSQRANLEKSIKSLEDMTDLLERFSSHVDGVDIGETVRLAGEITKTNENDRVAAILDYQKASGAKNGKVNK